MPIEIKIILIYICVSIIILMPVFAFIIYKIITKEHKKELKEIKKRIKKINN